MLTKRYDAVLASILFLALSFAGCAGDEHGNGRNGNDSPGVLAQADAADYYTCPMHPSVRSDRPGACPVCGMALVKKSAQAGSLADTALLQTVSLSPSQRVIANVATVPVERRALSREMHAVGVVAAAEPLQATVAARFRGRIEKLFVNSTGQRIRKGEPLFELYSPDLISAERDFLLALQAERGSASSGVSGTGSMHRQLLEASRDRLRVHFGLTEAQIEGLERSGRTGTSARFFSPISGTVLQKAVQQGMYVDEGMTLYQLADLSRVWVYLDVYERDLAMVKEGQSISVTTEAYPGRTFTGRVTFLDPVVDPATRTVRVRTELPNGEGLLKPNMFVRARLSAAGDPGLVVPRSAVLSTGPRTVVWVEIRKNEFEPREVAVGVADSGLVQVLRGVHEGEMVAQTGGFLIDSESALMMPPSPGESAEGHDHD